MDTQENLFERMLVVGIVLLGMLAISAVAGDYYVSPKGNDENPGTLQRPFGTLRRAQEAVRQINGREPVRVFLRGGTYYLAQTLTFGADDSGTKEFPVIYQAYQNERPVISGGVRLEVKWQPYRNGIVKAEVPAGFTTDQLFVNGKRQYMARYPDFNPNERIFNGYAADCFGPERAKRWKDPRGGFIHAMHSHMWGDYHYVITAKSDDDAVRYEGGWQNNRQMGMHGKYRFVENIFEELDAPGEWFLDNKTGTLYFYPPADVDMDKATIEAVRLRHLVEFRGAEQAAVRFVTLKGLTFRHAARTFMDNKEPMLRSDWTMYRGGAVLFDGTEDCTLRDCFLDQVGGNAVFVNNYNRRVTVRGCHIAGAGANGVTFVGDPKAARDPLFEYGQRQSYAKMDKTPGPKTRNFPGDCLVDDCLIYLSGRVEKQTSPVQIELSQRITVRHCSIYDVPRAGINIGDGCWGGHVIEFCDVFDTVKETGDHGSFNSWGRDRFWHLTDLDLNDDQTWQAHKNLPLLDVVETITLRNNRWRCDHGWDIDLDDGSSNYHLYNNLCLRGGIKNREGFYRVVENNIMVDNGFHPHVWYKHSQDVVERNIMGSDRYLPAGGMPSAPWGGRMDYNLVHRAGVLAPEPAEKLAAQSRRDEHSIVADAMFVDPPKGDFRVKDGSAAPALGFENFPMDRFGVQKPELKAIARVPQMPQVDTGGPISTKPGEKRPSYIWRARVRNNVGLGDRSAYGLPAEHGVLMLDVGATSTAAGAGLQKDDVIVSCNGRPVKTIKDLLAFQNAAAGTKLNLGIARRQKFLSVDLDDYAFVVTEHQAKTDFKTIPLSPGTKVLPARISVSAPGTLNDPVSVLADGKLDKTYGPVFGNGVLSGMYKLDLGSTTSIAQVNTWSFNVNANRGPQRFVLYASNSSRDPGWRLDDAKLFTPVATVDTRNGARANFVATSVRRTGGRPLGDWRWLVWAISPVTNVAGGENTAFQEFQVIGASSGGL